MISYKIVTATALPRAPLSDMSRTEWVEVRKHALPKGFRYVVTSQQEIVEPILLYLHNKCVDNAKIQSVGNTQETYCQDIYEWFSYLAVAGLRWDTTTTEDIHIYRERLLGFGRAVTTIRKRLIVILDFYKWAYEQRLLTDDIDILKAKKIRRRHSQDMLVHTRTGANHVAMSSLLPRDHHHDNADALSEAEITLVLDQLGPRIGTMDDLRPSRDRIIAQLALASGMRVHEIVALTLWQALGLVPALTYGASPLRITVTKGLKPRTVLIPKEVRVDIQEYIDTERAAALHGTGSKTSALFVNAANANRNRGGAVTAHTVERNFHRAVMAAGLSQVVTVAGPNGPERRVAPRHSFHDLRHTFAVNYYWLHRRTSDKEPWLTLKTLLGHANIQTTIETYLRSVSVVEAQMTDETTSYMRTLRDGQEA
jgi:site-specific recombinase XerD